MKYGKSEIKYISLLWIGWCAMNVRGILFFIVILCEVMAVHGNDNGVNLPREGDVLEMHKIDFVDTISCGKDCLWDLSSSNVSGKIKLSFTSEGKDSISCIVGRTRYKFLMHLLLNPIKYHRNRSRFVNFWTSLFNINYQISTTYKINKYNRQK